MDLENLQNSISEITNDIQLIKDQNSTASLELKTINSNLQMLNLKDNISKDTLYDTQEQLAKFISSSLAAKVIEVSDKVSVVKKLFEDSSNTNIVELREILGGLSLTVNSLRQTIMDYSDEKYSDIKNALKNLEETSNSAISNLDDNNSLIFSKIKSSFESANTALFEIIQSEFLQVKEILQALKTGNLENKLDFVSTVVSSNATSSQLEKSLNEILGQFEAIKYEIKTHTTNSETVNTIESLLDKMQNSVKEYMDNANSEFGELQKAMIHFNETVKSLSQDSENKLNETINETSAIKRDILLLKENLNEHSLKNKDILEKRFDSIFVQLSKLEQSFSKEDVNILKQNIEASENQFNRVISELENAKKENSKKYDEYFNSLSEKTEALKNELNLTTSDVLNNFTMQNDKLNQNIQGIKTEIENNIEEALISHQKKLRQDLEYYINSIITVSEASEKGINPSLILDLKKVEMNIVNVLTNISSENKEILSFLDTLRTINLSNKEDLILFLEKHENKIINAINDSDKNQDVLSFLDTLRTINLSNKEDLISYLEKCFMGIDEKAVKKEYIEDKFKTLQSDILSHIERKSQEDINIANLIKDLQQNIINIISERMQVLAMEAASTTHELFSDFKNDEKEHQHKNSNEIFDRISSLNEQASEEFKTLVNNEIINLKQSLIEEVKNLDIKSNSLNLENLLTKEIEHLFENAKFENLTNNIFEKTDDIESNILEQINNLKNSIIDVFNSGFNDFKEFYSTQDNLLKLSSEIKDAISTLENKFVEENINSTMEISKLLYSLLDEVSKLSSKKALTDSNEIQIVTKNKTLADISDIEKVVFEAKDEIKKILSIQHPLIKKIEDLGQKEDFEILQKNLKEVLISFNAKLDLLITQNQEDSLKSNLHSVIETIEKNLNTFGKDMISSVVNVFNGINFDVEKQEIKEYIQSNTEDIKQFVVDNQTNISEKLASTNNEIANLNQHIYDYLIERTQNLLTQEKTEEYVELFEQKIEELSNNFVNKFSKIDELNMLINDGTQDIESNILKLRTDVVDIIKTAFQDAFEEKYEKLKSLTEQELLDLKSSSDEGLSKVFRTLEDVNNLISLKFDDNSNNIENIKQEYNNNLSSIKDEIQEKIEKLIIDLKEKSDLSNEKTELIKGSLTSGFEELTHNILNIQNQNQTSFKDIKDEIIEKFDGEIKNFVNIQNENISRIYDSETNINKKIEEIIASINLALTNSLDEINKSKTEFEEVQKQVYNYLVQQIPNLLTIDLSKEQTTLMQNSIKELSADIATSVSSIEVLNDVVKNTIIENSNNISQLKTDIVDIIKTSFQEAFEEKYEVLKSLTEQELSDVKAEIIEKVSDSNLHIEDLKEIILNKFEDINEIKSILNLIPKDKNIDISEIENLLSKNLEELKIDLNISPQSKIDFRDIEVLVEKTVEDLKTNIEKSTKNSFNKEAIEQIITDKMSVLKDELAESQSNSNLAIKDVYDLLDERTEALNNQIHQIGANELRIEDIRDLLNEKLDDIKADLRILSLNKDEYQNDLIENLEDIKNVSENIDSTCSDISSDLTELKSKLQNNLEDIKNVSENIDSTCSDISSDLVEVKTGLIDNFDTIKGMSSNIDSSCNNISNDLNEVKDHLNKISDAIKENESDYPYSFEDIETDILKIRMILKDLTEKNALTRDEGLEKIEENLVSISTRTNKLLLNSDETSNFLQSSIDELKSLINLFDNKVNEFDYQRMFDKLENRMDEISSVVYSNAQTNKKLTEAFTYLAEWIDKTDEKLYDIEQRVSDISYIKQNMIKKSDLEGIFEKVAKKMEKQQEKIKTLEEKIKILSKPDTKLTKKVDGIDRQLVTLGKSIEKITSYVD